MNLKIYIILVLSSISLTGCDSGVLWQDDKYEVTWIDTGDNTYLYRKLVNGAGIGRVGPNIIAVGSNDKYVIVQQRSSDDMPIKYFIVDKVNDHDYANKSEFVIGPLSEQEYLSKTVILVLPKFEKL